MSYYSQQRREFSRLFSQELPYYHRRQTVTTEEECDDNTGALVRKDEKIHVVVGSNMTCINLNADDDLICNGPLGVGLSYRYYSELSIFSLMIH